MSGYYIDTYANGYTLSGSYPSVTIGPSGSIGGTGLTGGSVEAYTIVNSGTIAATSTLNGQGGSGIYLGGGGVVTNGSSGLISGTSGAYMAYTAGGTGVSIAGGAGAIDNSGIISGGAGSNDFSNALGYADGGVGVSIKGGAGTIFNSGTISGGAGGAAYFGGYGGAGGIGVSIADAGTISNYGMISGGVGGYGPNSSYDNNGGGAALVIGGAGTIDNSGTIAGGAGGNSGGVGGNGGVGVSIAGGGTIDNRMGGLIAGGAGGYGYQGNGGGGGAGVNISGAVGTVANAGTIAGGAGGGPSAADGTGVILGDGGTVVNYSGGLISGGIGVAAYGTNAATVVNYGTIDGTGGTSVLLGSSGGVVVAEAGADFIGTIVGGGSGGTLELAGSSGTISGLGTIGTISGGDSGTFTAFGSYVIGAGGSWNFTGTNAVGSGQALQVDGTLTDTGSLTIASGGSLIDNGLIKVNGGILIEDGSFSGGGTIDLTNSATLDLGVSVSGATIDFNDGSLLVLNQNGDYSGVSVKDFAGGDGILLNDIAFAAGDTAAYYNGQIYLLDGSGGTIAHFATTMTQASDPLAVQSNNGNAEIVDNAPCYCAGTMILTEQGEIAVENLGIGDMVVTASGEARPIRWIGRRSYAGRFASNNPELLPIRFKAGSIAADVPVRDLWVSPRHAMYLEGVLIPAAHLVNGMSVTRAERVDELQYFHIELASHDILLANGAASESYIDLDNRRMFENWASYAGSAAATGEYASRVVTGPVLAQARVMLAGRLPYLGYALVTDRAPHLVADGRPLAPETVDGCRYRFRLDNSVHQVRLVSRTSVPTDLAETTDRRRLGVPVRRIVVRTDHMVLEIEAGEPSLGTGFHAAEGGHRWTNGDAQLPEIIARLSAAGTIIELELAKTALECWAETSAEAA